MKFTAPFALLLSTNLAVFALPAPTDAPGTVFTSQSMTTESSLTVRATALNFSKWSSLALDIYRKDNQQGYIGWYDLTSKSFSGTYTSGYPQDTLMGSADVARQALINNSAAYVSGIVTILDPSNKPRCKIIFIGANGQPDANAAQKFVILVSRSSDSVPVQYQQ
ncbi:MAG: hypothetical protein P4L16_03180 [Chlamydiales bacterium]|nr:hypothetical protein [Chlamydiales bacterium]